MARAEATIQLALRKDRIPSSALVSGAPPSAAATKRGEGLLGDFPQRQYTVRVKGMDVGVQLNRGSEPGDAARLRSIIERWLWIEGA